MNKLNQTYQLLKDNIGLFLSISFGIFLFVIFFEPFPLERFEFNDRLIFISGLGGIIFALMTLIRIIFSLYIQIENNSSRRPVLPPFISGFTLMALGSVAFVFYLRYVGHVAISFHIVFKVALICLSAPIVLRIYDIIKELRQQNDSLLKERKSVQKQIEKYEEDYLNKSIEFISENNGENLKLAIADVAFIKSADNYVEVVYWEVDTFKKKLIRNTLKNIEFQIKDYTNFIRCHRVCIINTHFIEKLHKDYNNHWLTLKGYSEPIPVSRQYLLKLKETI